MADNLRKYTTQEVLNKVYTDSSGDTIGLQAQTSKETLNAVLNTSTNSLNVSLSGSNTISGDVTIDGDLTVNGSATNSYDEIVNGDLHVKSDSSNSTTGFLVEKNDGTDIFIVDTTNSNVKIPNGLLELGTADSTSGHINAFENMSFNIDTDNDDTNRFFEFSINGSSGAGTELMRLTEAGLLGIGTSSPSDYDAGGNNLVIYENGNSGITIASAITGIGAIHFADGTTGAEAYQGIVRYSHSEHNLQFGVAGTNYRFKLDNNCRISLSNNDGGADNTVFGKLAGNALTTNGDENVLIGHEAGNNMTTGERNVVIGYEAGDAMTIATRSVAIGYGALGTEDVGDRSIAIGFNSLFSQNSDANNETTGNVGIGVEAGFYNQTGQFNTLIGTGAGLGASEQSNSQNTAVGYASLNAITTGANNVAMGMNSLKLLTSGSHNVSIGLNSGDAVTDGSYNVFMGYYAGSTTTSATRSVAIGSEALETGDHDQEGTVAIGSKALQRVTTGAYNVAIGFEANANITTASWNTVIGYKALASGTVSANNNTAIGYEAGRYLGDNGTGNHSSFNTIIGRKAMGGGNTSDPTLNTAHLNIAIGHHALGGSTGTGTSLTATNNTIIGYASMSVVTSATNNVTLGYGAMQNATTASSNVAIGMQVMGSGITTGSENVSIGKDSMYDATSATGVVAIGTESANNITSGSESVAVGKQALYTATTVGANTAVGYQALKLNAVAGNTAIGHSAGLNTTGTANVYVGASAGTGATGAETYNTGIGYQALYDITSGSSNVVVGALAGENITTGAENTIVGTGAFRQAATGYDNVVIGREAMGLGYVEGHDNVVVGKGAGYDVTTGNDNTLVGRASGGNITTGEGNTLVGYQSGNTGTVDIVGGTYNTIIGYQARGSSASSINQIVIGKTAQGQGNNSVTLGNADVTDVYMAQDKGATVHADYVLSQGNQNHVANTMSSPYYRFDDVDDSITISSFPLVAQDSASGGYSIECLFRYSTGSGSFRGLFEFGDQATGERRSLVLNGSKLTVSHYSDNHEATTDLVDGQIYHAVSTVSSAGAVTMYLNGVAETISSGDGTVALTSYSGTTAYIGRTGSGEYFGGEIYHVKVFNNTLTATEVKELYSGMSVPFKYKGANQTNLVTNGGFDSNTNDWDAQNGTLSSESGGQSGNCLKVLQTTGSSAYASQDITTVIGKKYRFSFYVKQGNNANGGHARVGTSQFGNEVSGDLNFAVTGSFEPHSIEFTATTTTVYIQVASGFTGGTYQLYDTITCVPIGAVAEYDGSGIASDKWFDKSGNDLHGTVSGASVENAPSNDDGLVYEEGTWTPLPADASSGGNTAAAGTATGYYTRIGRMVHCEFTLVNINTTGMTTSNDFFVQQLPYTVANHAGHAHGSVALENVNFTGEYVTISPAGGTTAIRFAEVPDNGNIDIVMVSEINDDSADIYGHFSYMAT